jgi:hypothetical protein
MLKLRQTISIRGLRIPVSAYCNGQARRTAAQAPTSTRFFFRVKGGASRGVSRMPASDDVRESRPAVVALVRLSKRSARIDVRDRGLPTVESRWEHVGTPLRLDCWVGPPLGSPIALPSEHQS